MTLPIPTITVMPAIPLVRPTEIPRNGRNRLSYLAALTTARLSHTRTTEEMTAILLKEYPGIGPTSASTLVNYMQHVRQGTSITSADSTAMFNAIRMWACLGMYGAEMDVHNDEWFMLREIMSSIGLHQPPPPPSA
jgi:hypothetical protein